MIVLVANNSGREARRLAATFPGRVGHLYGPDGWRGPFPEFPYVLDNGAFGAWRNGRAFDDDAFRRLLDKAARAEIPPRWVAVPDVVLDAEATQASWYRWVPELRAYGWPLAFVVQDGHAAADVPGEAAVVFVGGSREWKWQTAPYWCQHFPRVHVGRVTTGRRCWHFHRAGAESTDGNVFLGDRAQLDGIWYYLADSEGLEHDAAHGPMQPRLFARGAA